MAFSIGDLISFSYPAVHQQGTRAHDKYPEILVLHDNWQGVVHGLNFNYLTADEINTIRMIIDPYFEMKYRSELNQKNAAAFQELEKIITTSGNPPIVSPRVFYQKVIKPFIVVRGYDPYRLYRPEKMSSVRVLQNMRHMTGQDVPQAEVQAVLKSTLLQKVKDIFTRHKPPPGREVDFVMQQLRSGQYEYTPQEIAALERYMRNRPGVMQWYASRVKAMRGPTMPGFPQRDAGQTVPTKPSSSASKSGALPGTRPKTPRRKRKL
jgi:hypothetical protein